jgi:hypothetical protein
MIRSLPLLTAALVLAACSRAPTDNQAAAAPGATTNYLAQIEALPAGQREGVFLRAIRDSGQDCQGVTKTQETQTDDGRPAWTATCTDGTFFVLVLGANGVMTVVSSANARGTG